MNLQRALEIFGLTSLKSLDVKGLSALYKKLAKEKHPDQGGSHKDFVLLKEAQDLLEKELANNVYDPNSTDLKTFSKEDILNKYYHDTKQLQVQIDTLKNNFEGQAETLEHIKSGAEEILSKFNDEKEKLKKDLESSIQKLEKNFTPTIWQKILFFKNRKNEKDFWDKYNQQVSKYAQKNTDLDLELYKVMLSIYGEGINNIAKLVGKVD